MPNKNVINTAEPTGEVLLQFQDDKDDFLYFRLKEKDHEFMMRLSDILECLKFAQEEGYIPEISQKWWAEISEFYPHLEFLIDVPEDDDEEI